jgi:signal transduction histidine kinase
MATQTHFSTIRFTRRSTENNEIQHAGHDIVKRFRNGSELAKNARDDLIARLTHELHTPLGVILGWTQMLLKTEVDNQTMKEALETIERNAEQYLDRESLRVSRRSDS